MLFSLEFMLTLSPLAYYDVSHIANLTHLLYLKYKNMTASNHITVRLPTIEGSTYFGSQRLEYVDSNIPIAGALGEAERHAKRLE